MSDLRLILLGLGVVLIVGIWLWTLHSRRRGGIARPRLARAPRRAGGWWRWKAKGRTARSPGPPRVRRGETRALDLPYEDEGPGEPPLGFDSPRARRGSEGADHAPGDEWDAPRRAMGGGASRRGADRGGRVPAEDDTFPAGPGGGGRGSELGDLQGLRATRDDPEQLVMDPFDLDEDIPELDAEDAGADGGSEEGEQRSETLVVVLTVLAPPGERIEGAALRDALEAQGLRYGDDRIFHRYPDSAPASVGPLYSAVNIVEPGVFDLEAMDSMHTPGVGLFMRLPGPKDPGDAFAEMVEAAREIAVALEAQLCDETRSKLTAQTLNHLREQIADFGRRRLLRV